MVTALWFRLKAPTPAAHALSLVSCSQPGPNGSRSKKESSSTISPTLRSPRCQRSATNAASRSAVTAGAQRPERFYQALANSATNLSGNQLFATRSMKTTTGLSPGIPACDNTGMDEFEREAARCVFVRIAGLTPTRDELELVKRGVGGIIL